MNTPLSPAVSLAAAARAFVAGLTAGGVWGRWRVDFGMDFDSQRLLAFERHTDRAADTVFVLANPGAAEVTETLMPANSTLLDTMALVDQLGGQPRQKLRTGLLDIPLPPDGVMVLTPNPARPAATALASGCSEVHHAAQPAAQRAEHCDFSSGPGLACLG